MPQARSNLRVDTRTPLPLTLSADLTNRANRDVAPRVPAWQYQADIHDDIFATRKNPWTSPTTSVLERPNYSSSSAIPKHFLKQMVTDWNYLRKCSGNESGAKPPNGSELLTQFCRILAMRRSSHLQESRSFACGWPVRRHRFTTLLGGATLWPLATPARQSIIGPVAEFLTQSVSLVPVIRQKHHGASSEPTNEGD